MDFDEDGESSSWKRGNRSYLYGDIEKVDDADEAVVVEDLCGEPASLSNARMVHQARENRFANRTGLLRDPDMSGGSLLPSALDLDHFEALDEDGFSFEIDEDFGHDVSKRIGRIIGSRAVEMVEVNFANGPPSYRPATPIPNLTEAKKSFVIKAEEKRSELSLKDATRRRAIEEQTRLLKEKEILRFELHQARAKLDHLEISRS